MRELFNVIPAELFRPLAAPGAPVYAGVLFALFAATKRHHQPLSRELAVNLIADLLAEPDAMSATDDVEEMAAPTAQAKSPGDIVDEADRIQERSGAVLRALVRYGWLRIETQSDFTQYYILPDYAFRLLETLERIAANEPIPLRGLIYSIYSMLQTAVSEGNEYIGISEASRQSRHLMNGLKELHHNIGAHIEQVYIDTILGDLITCERVDELRVHRRAVTPDVVFYGEWSVRAIRPDNFRPWFIGARAQRSQIEARERELESIRGELLALQPAFAAASSQVSLLEHSYELDKLRHRLDEPLDARPKWIEIEAFTAELQSLDMSGVEALKREVERLAAIANREQAAERQIVERLAQLRTRWQSLTEQNQAAAHELSEAGKQALDARAAFPAAVAAAEDLRAERLAGSQTDLIEVIRNAEIAARNFETRANNEQQELTRLAAAYNTGYQFAGNAFDPAGDSYSNEEQRLAATELPSYQQQIAGEQQRAEQQLREHVLHRLREKILQARQELERINDALANLEFHNKRYRFRYQPNEQYRPYYELIMESQMLGAESLFESAFYQQHQGVFEDFYRQLTKANENERAPLTDYRRYLSYDIEVKQNDGQISSLSKIMGQTSGGETQTPFYLTIAASFLQLYRIGEESLMAKNGHQGGAARPGGRSTIRLVAFDEAFSKMDQDHIGSTLELFQKFNLQIITATPLERCEYLVPKMCTNLVLTAVGDTVLIEPYRNYAARLEDAYAD
jgi:hypothetical protein